MRATEDPAKPSAGVDSTATSSPAGRSPVVAGDQSFADRDQRMTGKVVFVTGGTRGIGAAISRRFAAQGANVAAGYGRDRDKAEALLAQLRANDVEVSVHRGNVASSEDCRRTVTEVIERHGRLDVLVNNAGITIDKTVLKLTDEDWYKVLAVNLSGAFFMSQAVLPHMLERGSGRIINITSIIGQIGNIGQANYAASKSGLFGLTTTLAREAAFMLQRSGKASEDGIGITVNAVAPGFIKTEMLEHIPDDVLGKIRKQIPVGRLGRPEEIARVVRFLADDDSSFITGAVWGVNGGQEM